MSMGNQFDAAKQHGHMRVAARTMYMCIACVRTHCRRTVGHMHMNAIGEE